MFGGKEWERVGKGGKEWERVYVSVASRVRELHLFACTYLAGYDDGEVVGELEESEVEDVEERRRVASFEPAPRMVRIHRGGGKAGGRGGGEGGRRIRWGTGRQGRRGRGREGERCGQQHRRREGRRRERNGSMVSTAGMRPRQHLPLVSHSLSLLDTHAAGDTHTPPVTPPVSPYPVPPHHTLCGQPLQTRRPPEDGRARAKTARRRQHVDAQIAVPRSGLNAPPPPLHTSHRFRTSYTPCSVDRAAILNVPELRLEFHDVVVEVPRRHCE